ncbi:substrate-binding periplasmic protein [Marinobacter caseinilyticus]|uniref:substrate-binding periplasmic protein n=1 Tax=Marinobacter caseinilyticus TaxID=2692195 RepID=UPI00140DE15B|nr:transporter substrate-binding domain-containing protein [Marinobacter caseinilyticus]
MSSIGLAPAKRLFRAHCLVFTLVLSPAWVLSAESPERSAALSSALFATADVWPWAYTDDDGQPKGMLVEFTDRIAAIANIPVINHLRPHRRAIAELGSGESDFVVLFQSPTADATGICIARVVSVDIILATLAKKGPALSLESLTDESVGYIRGTYYGEAFENARQMKKVPVSNLGQAVDMLMLGRIDAVVSSDQALYHTLENKKIPSSRFQTDTVISKHKACLYLSRKSDHPEFRKSIQDAVRQLDENGELDELFRLPE